ncbi:hypothetical protein ACQEU6_12320 [Spirillospora sp. CA-108201]
MTAQQWPQHVITFADWCSAEHIVLEHLLPALDTSQSAEPHEWSFVRTYPTWRLRHHPTTDHGLRRLDRALDVMLSNNGIGRRDDRSPSSPNHTPATPFIELKTISQSDTAEP